MNTLDLKNILIHRISEINDIDFLRALKTILDSKAETKVIQLTPEQSAEIAQSKKDIENGLFYDSESLDKELKRWVNEK